MVPVAAAEAACTGVDRDLAAIAVDSDAVAEPGGDSTAEGSHTGGASATAAEGGGTRARDTPAAAGIEDTLEGLGSCAVGLARPTCDGSSCLPAGTSSDGGGHEEPLSRLREEGERRSGCCAGLSPTLIRLLTDAGWRSGLKSASRESFRELL